MSDSIDRVKNTIRKLMAVAGHSTASDNEIQNAMNLAAKLLDQHHLKEEDVLVSSPMIEPVLVYGQHYGIGNTPVIGEWERTLAHCVSGLFGTVQHYIARGTKLPIRLNGVVQMSGKKIKIGQAYVFYGLDEDAREAAELFTEWCQSISLMAAMRWGGAYKGEGAMYAKGFVFAVLEKVQVINAGRSVTQAKPLIGTTAITLADRYGEIKKFGTDWLAKEQGVKVKTRSYGTGIKKGSQAAYEEGKEHGAKAEFTRRTQLKRLA